MCLRSVGKACPSVGRNLSSVAPVGYRETINRLTEQLRANNYTIESEPRTTGDGYYESVV